MQHHETSAAPMLRRCKDLHNYTIGAADGVKRYW